MPPKTYLPSDVLTYVQHAHSAGYKEGVDFAIHAMKIFDVEKDSRVALVLEFLTHESRTCACDNQELDERLKELKKKDEG